MAGLSTGMIHGLIMMISFGWLLPLGVITAKYGRHVKVVSWYKVHAGLQLLGLMIGTVGFGIAVANFTALQSGDPSHHGFAHACVGVTVFALGLAQPVIGIVRPPLPDPSLPEDDYIQQQQVTRRRRWESLHKGFGYTILLLAFVAIMLGTQMEGTAWMVGYLVAGLGSLALAAMVLRRRSLQQQQQLKANHSSDTELSHVPP